MVMNIIIPVTMIFVGPIKSFWEAVGVELRPVKVLHNTRCCLGGGWGVWKLKDRLLSN